MLNTVTVTMTREEWLRYCEWLADRPNGAPPLLVGEGDVIQAWLIPDSEPEHFEPDLLMPEPIQDEPEENTGVGRPVGSTGTPLHCTRCGAQGRRRAILNAPHDGRCFTCRDVEDDDLTSVTLVVTPRPKSDKGREAVVKIRQVDPDKRRNRMRQQRKANRRKANKKR